MKRSEAYECFLKNPNPTFDYEGKLLCPPRRTPANADLIDHYTFDMESQMNAWAHNGEPVEGKRTTWTDGLNEWSNARTPKCIDGKIIWNNYEQRFPLEVYCEGFGLTGWNARTQRSLVVSYDFDDLLSHAKGVGISDEELERVKQAAMSLDWLEIRKSTGGGGLHVKAYFDGAGIPTADHTEHAALARIVLVMMSEATGFDFSSAVDCAGGVYWIWHRKMTTENGGLSLIKPATRKLLASDLPEGWAETIKMTTKTAKKGKSRRSGYSDGTLDPYEELATTRKNIALDAGHKAQIDALMEMSNYTTIWLADNHLLQTHTCALAQVKEDLKLVGYFKTSSNGNNPGSPNCFLFPLPNGAWRVFRFSPGVSEDPTWEQDGVNWTNCYFNRLPSLRVVAQIYGGSEDGEKCGEYVFTTATEGQEAAATLGAKFDLPALLEDRQTRLKYGKDGRLAIEIVKDKKDDAKKMRGWIAKPGPKWYRVFDVAAERGDARIDGMGGHRSELRRHAVLL